MQGSVERKSAGGSNICVALGENAGETADIGSPWKGSQVHGRVCPGPTARVKSVAVQLAGLVKL